MPVYDSVLMALCCDRWPCQRASPSAAAAQRRASPDRRIRERPTHLDAEELLDADADGGAAAPQADEVLREPKRPRKGSALRTERRSTEHGSRRTLRSDEIRWSGAHRWSVAVVPDRPGQLEAVHIQAVGIEENLFLGHGGRTNRRSRHRRSLRPMPAIFDCRRRLLACRPDENDGRGDEAAASDSRSETGGVKKSK